MSESDDNRGRSIFRRRSFVYLVSAGLAIGRRATRAGCLIL
jgi:hypothetical protein